MQTKKLLFFIALTLVSASCTKDKTQPIVIEDNSVAYVINAKDNSISVVDISENLVLDVINLPNANFPFHIYISPDKSLLAVSVTNVDLSNGFPTTFFNSYSSGNKVLVIDTETKAIVNEISLNQLASNAIFSPNGKELWIGQADDVQSKMLIYKVADWRLQNTINLGKGLAEITFCTDGDMSFTCTSGEDSVQMYNAFDKSFLMNSGLSLHPIGAFPSDHHTSFIICDGNNTVFEVNADNCETIDTISLTFKPAHINYNSSKSEMWMSDVTNNKIHWFKEINSHWSEQGSLSVGTNPRWTSFSEDGSKAFIANQNSNSMSIINVSDHSILNTISVGQSPSSIAFKP